MEPMSIPAIGIVLALFSALALSIGNLWQARGVRANQERAAKAGAASKFIDLFRTRFWLLGTLVLGLSIVFQMGSLTFAPLIVVQPIGVTALVFTVLLTFLVTKRAPSGGVVRAIAVSVLGVAAFVTVAALVSKQHAITSTQLVWILAVLVGVLVITAVMLIMGRSRRIPAIAWVLLGGIYSAFVATLGKTVIMRIQGILKSHKFEFDLANFLTLGCLVGIGVAGALSIYFVQRAHATNRPAVVVAGLTVIDPAVAVALGITILGEASGASGWAIAVFIIAGAVAVGGVFALSRADNADAEAKATGNDSAPTP